MDGEKSTRALFGWVGGKSRLRERIIPLIPEHKCYCEPFFGAGWVFFGKEPSKSEIINDIDAELYNLYRVVQRHPKELLRQLRWMPCHRSQWDAALKAKVDLTDVQRAAAYLFVIQNSFGNKLQAASFSVKTSRKNAFGSSSFAGLLQSVHDRLRGVFVENRPAIDVLKRFDKPHTFYYVDPPYYEVKGCYQFEMTPVEHAALRDALAGLKGKWLLSLNAVPEVRRLYSGFEIAEVRTSYSMSDKGWLGEVRELLIANYPLPKEGVGLRKPASKGPGRAAAMRPVAT